jgi:hypothetical protein
VSDDDWKQEWRDAVGGLLLQLAAGEIGAEDAQRELDTCKALSELLLISIDMGPGPFPPEEKMRREAALIEKWPEACRRAGVKPMPMPDEMMRAITSFVGRAS